MAKADDIFRDRRNWAAGPWDREPDRKEWRHETGIPCLIVRGPMGALCGYAGVAPGHPWHGKDYSDAVEVPKEIVERELDSGTLPIISMVCADAEEIKAGRCPIDLAVDVHGGITYSGGCSDHICHTPAEGETDNIWWFGFDCGHAGDVMPAHDATLRGLGMRPLSFRDDTYRDLAFVTEQTDRLAGGLAAVAAWPHGSAASKLPSPPETWSG